MFEREESSVFSGFLDGGSDCSDCETVVFWVVTLNSLHGYECCRRAYCLSLQH